jgi:hypothetical protein
MDFEVNENCLCVLRLEDSHDNASKLIIGFEPLYLNDPWDSSKYIDLLLSKVYINAEDVLELTNKLIQDLIPEYSNILKNKNDIDFTFCKFLSVAYQEVTFLYDYSIIKKDAWNKSISMLDYNDEAVQLEIKKIIKTIRVDLDYMTKIVALTATYKQCEKNNIIKFYSHRKRGWAGPIIELNSALSAKFDTNFGFGKNSYFYVKLIYKGVNIVPFSDLIRYRNIGEIKAFSRKFTPDNRDWQDAMEFVRDAYNLLMENESSFVQKFIVNEIQNLPKNLNTIMTEDAFYFDDIKYKYDELSGELLKSKFAGTELIKLRAEKLTQALGLIPTIEEFSDFAEIDLSILKIKKLNKDFLPILATEIDDLVVKISDANAVLKEMESILEDHQKKYNEFKQLRDDLEKELIADQGIANSNFDQKTLERLFFEKFPEYDEFKKMYSDLKQKLNIKKSDVNKMKTNHNLLLDYCEKIIKVLPENNMECTK